MAGSNKVLYAIGGVVIVGVVGLGSAWMLGYLGSTSSTLLSSSTTKLGKNDIEKMWEEYIKINTVEKERLTKDQFKYLSVSLFALTKLDRKTFDTFFCSDDESKRDDDKKKADDAHKKGEDLKKKWFASDDGNKEIVGSNGFFSEFSFNDDGKLVLNSDQATWLADNKDNLKVLHKEEFTKTFDKSFREEIEKQEITIDGASDKDPKYSYLDLAACRWFSLLQ